VRILPPAEFTRGTNAHPTIRTMPAKKAKPSFDHSPFVLAPQQARSRAALGKIVAAAATVIGEKGPDGFSMADVATASGVPVASIYRRFRGKEDLILAIKLDATSRIEDAVTEELSGRTFSDIRNLVSTYALTTARAFARDEALHHLLFNLPAQSSWLDQAGIEGKLRIFAQYRSALLPLLLGATPRRRELLVQVSFQIVASGLISKASGAADGSIALSWSDVASEFSQAAASYLESDLQGR
jgi:AcrR family transcriptional regulator